MADNTVTERLLIDQDPGDRPWKRSTPVEALIEVPPKATSSGWGDMTWAESRW